MTNDYKELLLKYLTGNLTNDYNVSTMSPYYEDTAYNIKSADNNAIVGDLYVQCKDANGKPNGKTIYYKQGENKLYLVDNDMNILNVYERWYTGTEFDKFLKLEVDEEGQLYGIDYIESTQKFRFILLNNLSEPVKMPNGTLEYRAVLRNSYFIQGYTEIDDISPTMPVFLGKSKQSATYYFALCDSTGETIEPSTFTINVGASNEWKRLHYILTSYSNKLDFIVYFDSEETPHASYFVYDFYLDDAIKRIDAIGENEPTFTTLINITTFLHTISSNDIKEFEIKAISENQWYFIVKSYKYWPDDGTPYGNIGQQLLRIFRENPKDFDDYIWDKRVTYYTASDINQRAPRIGYNVNANGDLSMFYGFVIDDDRNYDLISYLFIPNKSKYELPSSFFDVDTETKVYYNYEWVTLFSNSYNLNKGMVQTNNYGETTLTNTIVMLIYNDDNYNTEHFEKNGDDVRTLLPNQGILLDINNKPIFARNLYNKQVHGNRTISTLNVPNNMVNDVPINENKLISMFNNDIVDNTEQIEKNIYEDLYINYLNTITMQDQNRTTYRDNLNGAIRLNDSVNKSCDYENAKASKIIITYDDNTTHKGTIDNSITNSVCTYEFYVMVPNGKTIEKIDIVSDDENTIYQTIDYFPESLISTKVYKISQDVHVE